MRQVLKCKLNRITHSGLDPHGLASPRGWRSWWPSSWSALSAGWRTTRMRPGLKFRASLPGNEPRERTNPKPAASPGHHPIPQGAIPAARVPVRRVLQGLEPSVPVTSHQTEKRTSRERLVALAGSDGGRLAGVAGRGRPPEAAARRAGLELVWKVLTTSPIAPMTDKGLSDGRSTYGQSDCLRSCSPVTVASISADSGKRTLGCVSEVIAIR
jgi:hypothetical protein